MKQDNAPRPKSADAAWFGRNRTIIGVVLVLVLVTLAFAVGRRFSGSGEVSAPTADTPLAEATIPPTITRVPTATARAAPTAAPTETPVPSPTPVIITDAGALRRIESTQILQTTVFRIDTLVRAKKEGSWFFNWGGQNILLFVKGKVTAGIDLKELQAGNVSVSQDRRLIVIRLPPAKVLNAALENYEIEDFAGNKPSSVDTNLLADGLEAGRRQIAATACEDGILEHATNDAKEAFERILSFAEFADYQVLITTSPPAACTFDVVGTPKPQQ
jgi:Protein of unknown function (DUF4230)